MDCQIRKATAGDIPSIARTIANGFKRDLSHLTNDMSIAAKAIESAIKAERFFVAEQAGGIIGVAACSDHTGRAIYPNKKDFKKHFGLFMGLIGYYVIRAESATPLEYPPTTGFIEFVAVEEKARGQGVARGMLEQLIAQSPQYSEFMLDVVDVNIPAQKCYKSLGFVEVERVPVKRAKQKGFNSMIYMKYTRN